MTDVDAPSRHQQSAINHSANLCLSSFEECLKRASHFHPQHYLSVENQMARFSTWTAGIGVFATGRASMDHRLRYVPEAQNIVTGLLESLEYRIRTCSDVLDNLDRTPMTNAANIPDELLTIPLRGIRTEISHLNKITNTIRRASKEAQILRAVNFQIQSKDLLDGKEVVYNVEDSLYKFFYAYIGTELPNIKGNGIRERLARSMLLRRKQILYRRERQENSSTDAEQTSTIPAAPATASPARIGAPRGAAPKAPSQSQTATTLAPDQYKKAELTPSVRSESKTIALNKHQPLIFPSAPGGDKKKEYEKLMSWREGQLKKLEESLARTAPEDSTHFEAQNYTSAKAKMEETFESKLQDLGEIICPYCLHVLPAAEWSDKQKWQNHVKNDLDPYVCLFEECSQPDELYSHSDAWLNHMHQHRLSWRCSSHPELNPFSTAEEYMEHMRKDHNNQLSDNRLLILAKRKARRAVQLFDTCPLCGEEKAKDSRLEDHITEHLRSLALASLPPHKDEIQDLSSDENETSIAPDPQSRSVAKSLQGDGDEHEIMKRVRQHENVQSTKNPPNPDENRPIPHSMSNQSRRQQIAAGKRPAIVLHLPADEEAVGPLVLLEDEDLNFIEATGSTAVWNESENAALQPAVSKPHEMRLHVCSICHKSYNYRKDLRRHCNQKHAANPLQYSCHFPGCQKVFNRKDLLLSHLERCHYRRSA